MSYFKEFLKDKSDGAISSSSKAMGNVMYGSLNLKEAESVAEFGAGDGVFTTEILKLIGPNTKFFVFETNDLFIKILKEKISDDRVIIIKDSAEEIGKYILNYNILSKYLQGHYYLYYQIYLECVKIRLFVHPKY